MFNLGNMKNAHATNFFKNLKRRTVYMEPSKNNELAK